MPVGLYTAIREISGGAWWCRLQVVPGSAGYVVHAFSPASQRPLSSPALRPIGAIPNVKMS